MVLKHLAGFGLTFIDFEWLKRNKNEKDKLLSAATALKLFNPESKIEDRQRISNPKLASMIEQHLKTTRDNPWQTIDLLQSHGYQFQLQPEFFENHHVKKTKTRRRSGTVDEGDESTRGTDGFSYLLSSDSSNEKPKGRKNSSKKTTLKSQEELMAEKFEMEMRKSDEKEIENMTCPTCRVIRNEYFSFDMKKLLDNPNLIFDTNTFNPDDANMLVEAVNGFTKAMRANGRKDTLNARNHVVTWTNKISNPKLRKFGNIINFISDRTLSFYDTDHSKAIEILKTKIEKKFETFNILNEPDSNSRDRDGVDPNDIEIIAHAAGLSFIAERFKTLSSSDVLELLKRSENNLKIEHVIRSSQIQFRDDLEKDPKMLSHAAKILWLPDPTQKGNHEKYHVGCMNREIPGIVGDYFKALMSLE